MSTPIANIAYEKFVLSAMLLRDGEIVPDIAAILKPEDFYRPEHKIIFNAILQIDASKDTPVNMLTLVNTLNDSKDEHGVSFVDKVGVDYLFSLPQVAHTTAYATFYAKDIKDKSDLRKISTIANKIATDANSGLKSPLDIIAESATHFSAFSNIQNSRISDVGKYLMKDFWQDVESQKAYSLRSTGFSNIDKYQIFSPGLYVLGAIPACGKTTFAWQLAEQLAITGENCIFCSYEMSRLELASKTIARQLFIDNPNSSLTSAQIRKGGWSNHISNIVNDFFHQNYNLRIIELQNETVDDLLKILRPLCSNIDKAPVVFIDYLQIMPSNNVNTKLAIDDSVRKLKLFQRETNTTFIVVSSLNRNNYCAPVSFESFKESGNIEYTADVIWALQLYVMNTFKDGTGISQIRKTVDDAKKQQPRQLQLKCLKNRQGSNYDSFFFYYSAFDYFQPCDESDFEEVEGPPEKISVPVEDERDQ